MYFYYANAHFLYMSNSWFVVFLGFNLEKKLFDFRLMHDVFSYVAVLGRHQIYFLGLELKNKTKQKNGTL